MRKIKRSDVLLRLDGTVFIEGESGRQLANVFVRANDNAMKVFRKLAPDIQPGDISIDELGRVRINNAKVSHVARALAESEDPSVVGRAISTDPGAGGVAPADVTAGGDISPPDDVSPADDRDALEVDLFCRDEGPDRDLDIICGRWDEEGEGCDLNFGCGYFS